MAVTLAVLAGLAWFVRPRPGPPPPPRRTRELITTSLPTRAAASAADERADRPRAAAEIESASSEVPLPTPVPTEPARLPLSAQSAVRPPELIHRVEPEYPEPLRQARVEGLVEMEAVVTEAGEISNLRVARSTDPRLEAPARAAVAQWRYRPATFEGKPVKVYLTITTSFRLRP